MSQVILLRCCCYVFNQKKKWRNQSFTTLSKYNSISLVSCCYLATLIHKEKKNPISLSSMFTQHIQQKRREKKFGHSDAKNWERKRKTIKSQKKNLYMRVRELIADLLWVFSLTSFTSILSLSHNMYTHWTEIGANVNAFKRKEEMAQPKIRVRLNAASDFSCLPPHTKFTSLTTSLLLSHVVCFH
jgi:hypothetical protein